MTRMMYDMSRLAFQSDSTRVITLFLGGQRTPGVKFQDGRSMSGYHNISHHGKDEAKLKQLETIENEQMTMLNELLQGLRDVGEGRGSLLDNTMVLYGSNMSDGNIHNNTNAEVKMLQHGQRQKERRRRQTCCTENNDGNNNNKNKQQQ